MTTTTAQVQVMVWAVDPPEDPGAVERAYHRISRALAGTPGLLGNRLLRSPHDPARYVVVSDWRDLTAFSVWEQGPDHRGTTAPLRPYQDPARPAAVYAATAAYTAGPVGA